MNHIKTPVTATQNQIVQECWYVTDANGQTALLGTERDVKEIVELLNQCEKVQGDGLGDRLPDLGDNGPVFAISDDGAEFLAAIEYLEKNPDRPYQYLGWQISSHGFYQAWKKDFYLRCIIARNLVTAIYTLEMNGVTEPATDEETDLESNQVLKDDDATIESRIRTILERMKADGNVSLSGVQREVFKGENAGGAHFCRIQKIWIEMQAGSAAATKEMEAPQ